MRRFGRTGVAKDGGEKKEECVEGRPRRTRYKRRDIRRESPEVLKLSVPTGKIMNARDFEATRRREGAAERTFIF